MTKVTIEFDITEEDFEDIPFGLSTSHWANVYERNWGVPSERGYIVRPFNDYGKEDKYSEHTVTFDEMREAFARIATNRDANGNPYHITPYIREYFSKALFNGDEPGRIDTGEIDTDAADVWLQIAIWDEVLYG